MRATPLTASVSIALPRLVPGLRRVALLGLFAPLLALTQTQSMTRIDLAHPGEGLIIEAPGIGGAGALLSILGDINGDGIADFAIGAKSNGDTGRIFVLFGKTGGLGVPDASGARKLDLTNMNAQDGFIIEGETPKDGLGTSIAPLGNLRGDGLAAFAIGAPYASTNNAVAAGKVYVIFGQRSASGVSFGQPQRGSSVPVLNLARLDTQHGFLLATGGENDAAGFSLANAGNVNGSGKAALLIGADGGDKQRRGGDKVWLISGEALARDARAVSENHARPPMSLAQLHTDDGFVILNNVTNVSLGASVAGLGDINGDGLADFAIGVPGDARNGELAGAVAVVLGRKTPWPTQLLLSRLSDDQQGFWLLGSEPGALAGYTLAGLGDINGDGLADFAVGAPGVDREGGRAYVLLGRRGVRPKDLKLSDLPAQEGFSVRGQAGQFVGASLAGLGDVNGDGIGDFLVGGYGGSGRALVVFGQSGPPHWSYNFDINQPVPGEGQVFLGDALWASAGIGVAGGGDVNGDGANDFLISSAAPASAGASSGGSTPQARARVYLLFGHSAAAAKNDRPTEAPEPEKPLLSMKSFDGILPLATLSAAQGQVINGASANAWGGSALAGCDVRGSGDDDLIIGAYGEQREAGRVYVVYASALQSERAINLRALKPSEGFVIEAEHEGDWLGASVACAGDVDGDGIADFLVGAPRSSEGGPNSGRAYLIYGQRAQRGALKLKTLRASEGVMIQGDTAFDNAGLALSGIGDINRDGLADYAIGAPGSDYGGRDAGSVYVIFGSKARAAKPIDLANFSPQQGFVVEGAAPGAQAGSAIAPAGDMNGDGAPDFLIGAPKMSAGKARDAGAAYLLFGHSGGVQSFGALSGKRRVIRLANLNKTAGLALSGRKAGEQMGLSLAYGGHFWRAGSKAGAKGAALIGAPGGGRAYLVLGRNPLTALEPDLILQGDPEASAGFTLSAGAPGALLPGSGAREEYEPAGILIGAYKARQGKRSAVGRAYFVRSDALKRALASRSKGNVAVLDLRRAQEGLLEIQGAQANSLSGVALGLLRNGEGTHWLMLGAPGLDRDRNTLSAGGIYVIHHAL